MAVATWVPSMFFSPITRLCVWSNATEVGATELAPAYAFVELVRRPAVAPFLKPGLPTMNLVPLPATRYDSFARSGVANEGGTAGIAVGVPAVVSMCHMLAGATEPVTR